MWRLSWGVAVGGTGRNSLSVFDFGTGAAPGRTLAHAVWTLMKTPTGEGDATPPRYLPDCMGEMHAPLLVVVRRAPHNSRRMA